MCIKIGGYVRFEASCNTNGSSTRTQGGDLNNRYTNELWYRVRGYITADARNQTEYGTVRGYIALGISTDTTFDPPQTFNANRAFIQWAGFTFGRAQSFFDFFSQAAVDTWASRRTPTPATAAGKWLAILRSWATASRPASPPKIGVRRRSSGRASRLVILPPLSMVSSFQVKYRPERRPHQWWSWCRADKHRPRLRRLAGSRHRRQPAC